MAKSQLPNALDLRILALYIERDMLSLDQKEYLANALRAVASGDSAAVSFGVKRAPHRPESYMTEYIVSSIFSLTQPRWNNSVVSVTTAIDTVAKDLKKSPRTVSNAYYSKKGKEVLKQLTPPDLD